MQKRILSLIAAAALFSGMAAGCSEKRSSSTATVQPQSSAQTSSASTDEEAACMPVLSLNDTSGKPGDIVDVVVSVHGAEGSWAYSGVHFAYDEELEPVMDDSLKVDFRKGSAIEDMSDFLAVNWTANGEEDRRTDEMKANNWNSIFFCTIATDDAGHDGDIAAFQFKIPEDAEPGKVYDLTFFYYENDMFTNVAKNQGMQDYAFSNWVNGSITVEQNEEDE